jgi:hypothetical protein
MRNREPGFGIRRGPIPGSRFPISDYAVTFATVSGSISIVIRSFALFM